MLLSKHPPACVDSTLILCSYFREEINCDINDAAYDTKKAYDAHISSRQPSRPRGYFEEHNFVIILLSSSISLFTLFSK